MTDKYVSVPVDFCRKLIAAIRETNNELFELTGERYPDFESSVDGFEKMIDSAPEPASKPPCQGCTWEQSHRVSCCTHPENTTGKMITENCPIMKPVSAEPVAELEEYDAGYLNDFGGGNVGWWQDYIRAELGRAHDFYQSQVANPPAQHCEPIGYLFERSSCRAPDDCEEYLEFVELKDIDNDELSIYQKHGRAIPLYTHLPAHQWIKCSERLPTEKDGDKYGHVLWLAYSMSVQRWCNSLYRQSATHWMPLPQPPEVE